MKALSNIRKKAVSPWLRAWEVFCPICKTTRWLKKRPNRGVTVSRCLPCTNRGKGDLPGYRDACSERMRKRHSLFTPEDRKVRASHLAILRIAKTHCVRGHSLCGDNLYLNQRSQRSCRACWTVRRKPRSLKRSLLPRDILSGQYDPKNG